MNSRFVNIIAVIIFIGLGGLVAYTVYSSSARDSELAEQEQEHGYEAQLLQNLSLPAAKTDNPRVNQWNEEVAAGNALRRRALEALFAFDKNRTKKTAADLDQAFADLRKSENMVTREGVPLDYVYQKLERPTGLPNVEPAEPEWKARQALLEKWGSLSPQSTAPLIAQAGFWIQYAWLARGNGYASTVDDDAHRLFAQRLQKASSLLDQAQELGAVDPQYYCYRITLEMAQGGNKTQVNRFVDSGRQLAPQYLKLYNQAATFYLPRWHGVPGAGELYANSLYDNMSGPDGKLAYLSMVRQVHVYDPDTVFDGKYDPEKVRTAMLDMLDRPSIPGNMIDLIAEYAWGKQDVELAKRLHAMHGNPAPTQPGSAINFKLRAALSLGGTGTSELGDRHTWLPRRYEPREIAFSPDSKQLAVATFAFDFPPAVLIDVAAAEIADALPFQAGACAYVRFLTSEKLLIMNEDTRTFGGSNYRLLNLARGTQPLDFAPAGPNLISTVSADGTLVGALGNGKAHVWETAKGQIVATFPLAMSPASVHLTRDNKQLVAVGAGRVDVFDIATQKLSHSIAGNTEEDWTPQRGVGITAEGKLLLATQNLTDASQRAFHRIDLATGKSQDRLGHPFDLHAACASDDGRYFAFVGRAKNVQRVVMYEVQTKKKLLDRDVFNSAVGAIAISPDGRTVACADKTGVVRFYDVKEEAEAQP